MWWALSGEVHVLLPEFALQPKLAENKSPMQSRAMVFCLGAAVGLGGAVGVHKIKPKLLEDTTPVQKSPPNATDDSQLFRYGYPEPHVSTHSYTAHSLTYDRSKKVPLWVAESINKDMVTGRVAHRKKSEFQPDPKVSTEYCSQNEDYRGSGWSRGHMAPAGDYKHCQNSMDDTFYLTNIVPQNIDNNSGYWNSVEDYCRRLAKNYSQVNVISGPLYLPKVDSESNKKYVKYEVIGKSNVAVPTHLYKVVLVEDDTNSQPMLGVFVVPNEPIGDIPLSQFQMSLEMVERYTGTKFHCKLDRSKTRDLCATDGCKLKSQKEWAIWAYQKKLQGARGTEELEKLWQEVQAKAIQHDKRLSDLYSKKRTEFAGPNIAS